MKLSQKVGCAVLVLIALYYTVNYQFIESSTDNLEKLFQ